MLLNNYIKLKTQNSLTPKGSGVFINDLGYTYRGSNGNTFTLNYGNFGGADPILTPAAVGNISTVIPSTSTSNYNQLHIVFGNGNTPVTPDDYTIAGTRITNISPSAVVGGITDIGTTVSYIFTNNNATNVTISEVCIFGGFAFNTTNIKFAIWREVFDEPLTVPAGVSFMYTIEITSES